jgi:ElaB/YqjD/DUF883 family membrane-anchored ribosome-binding protein
VSSFRIFPDEEASHIVVPASPQGMSCDDGRLGDRDRINERRSDLVLFREDLDAVKRDVASLIEHMKDVATSTVRSAACQVEQGIRSVHRHAGVEGERSANALNLFVQNRPFVALTIAVGAGYIGARVLGR